MSLLEQYLCGAVELTLLADDASEKVKWVAGPLRKGELVKERIYRASVLMPNCGHELVRAAYHKQIGPYQWPYVHNDWLAVLQQRTASDEENKLRLVHERKVEPITRAQANLALVIAGLRKVG